MQKIAIPLSIIIAGALIAGAVIFDDVIGGEGMRNSALVQNSGQVQDTPSDSFTDPQSPEEQKEFLDEVIGLQENDHVRGNPDAPVLLIEYSDVDCPFCVRHHDTMNQLLEKYGDQVAWVYRHLPIDQNHPNARKKSELTECVADSLGNDAFWISIDEFLSGRNISFDQVLQKLETEGFTTKDVEECLEKGTLAEYTDQLVADSIIIAQSLSDDGRYGTPLTLVYNQEEGVLAPPVSGAQPINIIETFIDGVINN